MITISKIREQIIEVQKAWRPSTANLNNATNRIDVTEHKQMEEALQESEEKFFKAFRSSPDAIAITTLKDGKFIEVNDSFPRITGYTREELINHSSTELGIWAEVKERARMIQILKEQGRVYNEEFKFRMKSGEIRIWLFSAELINIGGEPCLISMTTDITEHKQAEERLEHVNSVLLAIRNVNQLITKEKDCDRLLKGVSDELIETRGYYNVWISLLDDSEGFIKAVESGLGKDFLPLAERFEHGELSNCARTALMQSGVVVTEDPSTNCSNCPLAKIHRDRGILTIRMEYDSKVYGLLTASIPITFIRDEGEQMLFKEVAGDIAFALHDIALAEEHRRAEESLQESEEKFSKAFRSSPDAIAITTLKDGKFIEVNDSYTRITGYTREEVIGHSTTEFGVWAKAEERTKILRMLKEQGRVSNEEVHMYMKSGKISTSLFSAELISIGGEPCMISVATDITELKQAEEALANEAIRRRILIEQSSDGIVIIDENGKVYEANRRFAEMLGYSSEEVLQLYVWDWDTQFTHEQLLDMLRNVSEAGDHFETYHQRKDGTIYDVEISTNGATFAGQKLIFCVCRDITERKKIEERNQAIIKTALDGFWLSNLEGKLLEVNDSYCKMVGYTREELLNMSISDIEALENREDTARHINSTAEQGYNRFETQHKRKDGKTIDVEVSVNYLAIGEGQLFVFVRDITGRKRAGQALRESEEKFFKAFRSSPDAIAITTLKDGKFIEVNDSYTRITGYSREEVIGHSTTEFGVWAKAEERTKILRMLKEQGRVNKEEVHLYMKSGEISTGLFSAELINVGGEPGMISVATDITELKRAEERLEHLNSVLLAIRNVNQLITKEKDRDRLLKGICDELIETRGYYNVWISLLDDSEGFITAVESGLGKDFLPLAERFEHGELNNCARTALMQSEVVVTEDPSTNCIDCPLAKIHRGRGILTIRMEYDGKVYGLLTASIPIAFTRDEGEQMLFKEVAGDIAFALHDIALAEGRKQAEEALRESEEKFFKAFRSSPDMITITTLKDGKFIEVNDTFTRVAGYTREEVIGQSSVELSSWAKTEERDRILQILKEQGRVSNEEVHMYMKSGETGVYLFSAEIINIGGEPCMISVATDITEHKRAEEALRESEEFTSSLLDKAPNPIVVIHPDTSIKYVNPAFENLTGFTLAEAAGMKSPHPWWPEESREEMSTSLNSALASGGIRREMIYQKKNGESFCVELNAVSIMKNGILKYFLVNWLDITENKQAEEALRESDEFSTSLLENAPNPITVINPDTSVKYVNPAFEKLTGFSLAEIAGIEAPYPWWPKERKQERTSGLKGFMGGGNKITEQTIQKKSGEILVVELNMVRVIHNGIFKYYLAHWNDVTEQKKAEEALKESEEKYRDLLDNTNDLIQSVTPDGRFRYVNNGWRQALGYSEDEISNLRVFDILHPDCLQHYVTLFQKMKSGEDIGRINTTFVNKNGNKIVVEGNVTGKYVNGELIYTRNIFRDITQNKYLEEQMFRLSSAVSMSTDCIVITDFDARVIDVNQKTLEIYGADSKEELLGKHFLELIVPAERETANVDVGEIIEKGYLECREYKMLSKQGREFPVQMSTSLVKDADGKPMGMVRVGREIS